MNVTEAPVVDENENVLESEDSDIVEEARMIIDIPEDASDFGEAEITEDSQREREGINNEVDDDDNIDDNRELSSDAEVSQRENSVAGKIQRPRRQNRQKPIRYRDDE